MNYGLVLSGGGGKGGYHIGVWKALREMDINITAVTGTSVGSLIGAMVVMDSYDQAYDMWTNLHYSTILDIDEALYDSMLKTSKSLSLESLNRVIRNGVQLREQKGLDITPLKQLIDANVDEDLFRNSSIDYGLVTVSLTDRKALELFKDDIPKGKLKDYLLASSFLPGFSPTLLDGKHFIDGGFHDIMPINMMLKEPVDRIIAVDIGGIGRRRIPKNPDCEITIILPSGTIASTMEFDATQSRRDIQMGYMDTLKAFGRVSGLAYYIENLPTDIAIMNYLNKLSQAYINKLCQILKLSPLTNRRMVYEQLVPQIAKLFDCNHDADYTELLLNVIEYMANHYQIERLRKYTFNELMYIVLDSITHSKEPLNPPLTTYTMDAIRQRLRFSTSKHHVAKLLLQAYMNIYEVNAPTWLEKHYTITTRNISPELTDL